MVKTYPNGANALRGVSLSIEKGDVFGIVGRSGAGKSTMLKLMGMLDTPTSGRVNILGNDITAMSNAELNALRRQIGTVFQGFNLLLQRNVLKNIAFPLELLRMERGSIAARANELAALVGLDDKIKSYPAQLSGGQKQRVAIARALAPSPKILLCDEPTSALDSFTTREILHLLKDINEKLGITIIIITHEIGVVKAICNRAAVLDDGLIAEMGDTLPLLSNPQSPATKLLLGEY